VCALEEVPRRLLDLDPCFVPWRAHLRAHPMPVGERVLVARLALAWATGVAPSPCFAVLLRDTERALLEAGPKLRRVYSYSWTPVTANPPERDEALRAQLTTLGFLPIKGEVVFGTASYEPSLCDLGPESVAGWLSELAARDLDVEPAALDEAARELRIHGARIALSKLECDVLAYLRAREGQPVERETLLREVWGYEWTGGSNVVEVAISGLRRKLGEHASALETVRGVGYRLKPFTAG
jgi:hypothetical protein